MALKWRTDGKVGKPAFHPADITNPLTIYEMAMTVLWPKGVVGDGEREDQLRAKLKIKTRAGAVRATSKEWRQ